MSIVDTIKLSIVEQSARHPAATITETAKDCNALITYFRHSSFAAVRPKSSLPLSFTLTLFLSLTRSYSLHRFDYFFYRAQWCLWCAWARASHGCVCVCVFCTRWLEGATYDVRMVGQSCRSRDVHVRHTLEKRKLHESRTSVTLSAVRPCMYIPLCCVQLTSCMCRNYIHYTRCLHTYCFIL